MSSSSTTPGNNISERIETLKNIVEKDYQNTIKEWAATYADKTEETYVAFSKYLEECRENESYDNKNFTGKGFEDIKDRLKKLIESYATSENCDAIIQYLKECQDGAHDDSNITGDDLQRYLVPIVKHFFTKKGKQTVEKHENVTHASNPHVPDEDDVPESVGPNESNESDDSDVDELDDLDE